MIVQVEVDENGILLISDPEYRGKKFSLELSEKEKSELERDTNWEEIKAIVKQANSLNFPRRTHEEILKDVHELRG